jgi:hypothetical protein
MKKKFSDEFIEKWESIIENVEKSTVPVDCIKKIVLRLENRKQKTINIKTLLTQGLSPEEVELVVGKKINEHESEIKRVEFFIDIESVASRIQPETDRLFQYCGSE